MTVAYTGSEMKFMNLLATWLSQSVAFQTLAGVQDDPTPVPAARAQIVEIDGDEPTGGHAVIGEPISRAMRTPGGAWRIMMQYPVFFEIPPTADDPVVESHRRSWNTLSDIRKQIIVQVIETGHKQLETIEVLAPMTQDDSDPYKDWQVAGLVFYAWAQAA